MFTVPIETLTSQVAPCRFTLGERVAITAEAIRRGSKAEFLDTEDGQHLAAIDSPYAEDGFAIGRNADGAVTVASLSTGRTICTGSTVLWAMTTWRALG